MRMSIQQDVTWELILREMTQKSVWWGVASDSTEHGMTWESRSDLGVIPAGSDMGVCLVESNLGSPAGSTWESALRDVTLAGNTSCKEWPRSQSGRKWPGSQSRMEQHVKIIGREGRQVMGEDQGEREGTEECGMGRIINSWSNCVAAAEKKKRRQRS